MSISRVVVFGCGTIGLATAGAFAASGIQVEGIDVDDGLIDRLQQGRFESGEIELDDVLSLAAQAGRITFTGTAAVSAARSAFVIAVPMPVDRNGIPQLGMVEDAVRSASAKAADNDILVVRSTVPVGTTRRMAHRYRWSRFACCPDRSIAGQSFRDQSSVPHLIGEDASEEGSGLLFQRIGEVAFLPSPESAELAKLFCNIQRDVSFALANEFALISDRLHIDLTSLRSALEHNYSRFSLPRAGPVGGPCLSKDAFLLAHSLPDERTMFTVTMAGRRRNAGLAEHLVEVCARHAEAMERQLPQITILGMAFKGQPPVKDRRGGLGEALVAQLASRISGASVTTFDPALDAGSLFAASKNADIVILANDHPSLIAADLTAVARLMNAGGLILDAWERAPYPTLPNQVRLRSLGRTLSMKARGEHASTFSRVSDPPH